MLLLIAEGAGFHESLSHLNTDSVFISFAAEQLHHHPWHGLRFWDLIQPFFMFIVGVAMPFSLGKRLARGSRSDVTKHVLRRCFLLFSFGVLLHCVYSHALVWELWNVLVQLSMTILIAYLIMNLPHKFQIVISIGLLVLTELLYRLYNGSAPYNDGQSFGSWGDLLLMGKINDDGWVTVNFIPTAAHTIWGVICGQILFSEKDPIDKIRPFLISGIFLIISGYLLNYLNITPIIKRIATTSFTLVSGGYAILVLALLYWIIDIKRMSASWLKIFTVVGTNSIFIYLFTETIGVQWLRSFHIWIVGASGHFRKLSNGD